MRVQMLELTHSLELKDKRIHVHMIIEPLMPTSHTSFQHSSSSVTGRKRGIVHISGV